MADANHTLGEAIVALAVKLGPGILGSLIALRGLPPDATWGQRLLSFVGGASAAFYIAPAVHEWAGMTSRNSEALLAFVAGAFAMVVVGEITATIKQLELAVIARDTIRKFLRIDRG